MVAIVYLIIFSTLLIGHIVLLIMYSKLDKENVDLQNKFDALLDFNNNQTFDTLESDLNNMGIVLESDLDDDDDSIY